MRIARNVPEPPVTTPEERARLMEESREWRRDIAMQTADIEAIARPMSLRNMRLVRHRWHKRGLLRSIIWLKQNNDDLQHQVTQLRIITGKYAGKIRELAANLEISAELMGGSCE